MRNRNNDITVSSPRFIVEESDAFMVDRSRDRHDAVGFQSCVLVRCVVCDARFIPRGTRRFTGFEMLKWIEEHKCKW